MAASYRAFQGFSNLNRFLRSIGPTLRDKILPQRCQLLAHSIETTVVQRYLNQATQLGATSMLVAQRGKEHGALSRRPAKRPVGTQPLFHILASSVRTARLQPGRFRIHVDPSSVYKQGTLRYPQGVPLGFLAWTHENQRGSFAPITRLMVTYLMALRSGKGGYGTRRRTKASRNSAVRTNSMSMSAGIVVLFPPKRPVWGYVIATQLPKLLNRFGGLVLQDVMKEAMRFGGRPTIAAP